MKESAALDYEDASSRVHRLRVAVTDAGGLADEVTVVVAVTDANDAPSIPAGQVLVFGEDAAVSQHEESTTRAVLAFDEDGDGFELRVAYQDSASCALAYAFVVVTRCPATLSHGETPAEAGPYPQQPRRRLRLAGGPPPSTRTA